MWERIKRPSLFISAARRPAGSRRRSRRRRGTVITKDGLVAGEGWRLAATDHLPPLRLQAGRAAQLSGGLPEVRPHTQTVPGLRQTIVLPGRTGAYYMCSCFSLSPGSLPLFSPPSFLSAHVRFPCAPFCGQCRITLRAAMLEVFKNPVTCSIIRVF